MLVRVREQALDLDRRRRLDPVLGALLALDAAHRLRDLIEGVVRAQRPGLVAHRVGEERAQRGHLRVRALAAAHVGEHVGPGDRRHRPIAEGVHELPRPLRVADARLRRALTRAAILPGPVIQIGPLIPELADGHAALDLLLDRLAQPVVRGPRLIGGGVAGGLGGDDVARLDAARLHALARHGHEVVRVLDLEADPTGSGPSARRAAAWASSSFSIPSVVAARSGATGAESVSARVRGSRSRARSEGP